MRWVIHPELRGETVALEFCREFAGNYQISKLDWIRIDLGRGHKSGAYGRCWYPAKSGEKGKGYRISIQVPGRFLTIIGVT